MTSHSINRWVEAVRDIGLRKCSVSHLNQPRLAAAKQSVYHQRISNSAELSVSGGFSYQKHAVTCITELIYYHKHKTTPSSYTNNSLDISQTSTLWLTLSSFLC